MVFFFLEVVVDHLINLINEADGDYESFTIHEIVEVLKVADDAYHNDGFPIFEDSVYDALKLYAHTLSPTHPYFLGVGSSVRGGKVPLPFPMGSLTQVYQGDTQKWVANHNLQKEKVVVSDKLDGFSALLVYDSDNHLQIAYSRGDGIEGADIFRHIRKIPSVPLSVRNPNLVVRGEVIIPKEKFVEAQASVKSRSGKPYKNARNMVSGLMNAEDNPDRVYQYLEFVAYEIVQGGDPSSGFKTLMLDELILKHQFFTPGWYTFTGEELTDHTLTVWLNERRNRAKYELDGLVLDVNRPDIKHFLGFDTGTLNPKYARKYKVADESNLAVTTVKEVQWNISKDGYLKPRIKVEPIDLVGVTIQHATGFNAQFIAENKIGPGAKVKITRSGDVIPFIIGVVEPMTSDEEQYYDWFDKQISVHGDWEWTDTGVDIFVTDIENNKVAKFERLLDFFTSINVPHLKEGNLQKIFDAGFETPEDVIELTQQDLSAVLNSDTNGKKVFDGIKEKLTAIPEYVLMGSHSAFGRGVGVRKMKKLYDAFKGDMLKCENRGAILSVEGFESKTANKVVNGMVPYLKFKDKISKYVTIAPYEGPKAGKFSGQKVVFTGFRNAGLEQKVVEQGGTMSTSVSKNTSLVVASDVNSSSGKASKAKELGVKVISVEELMDMISD